MPIRSSNGPVGGRDIIITALTHLLPKGTAVEIGRPLAAFSLSSSSSPLTSARRVGWRYLITVDGAHRRHMTVDLRNRGKGNSLFHRLCEGERGRQLVDAAQLAEKIDGNGSARIAARILRIEAGSLEALWLSGADNVFFTLTQTVERCSADTFLAKAQNVEERRKRSLVRSG